MKWIQQNVALLRDEHRRYQENGKLAVHDEIVPYFLEGSRRRILSPVSDNCWGGCRNNVLRNFKRRNHKVIWYERPIDVRQVFKYRQ